MTLPRTTDSLQTEKITIIRSVGKWELFNTVICFKMLHKVSSEE